MKLSNCILLSVALALASVGTADAATLYGSTASGGPGELYVLNPSTGGMIQDVGPLNDALNVNYGVTGLAFNPITGLLYGSTANADPATAAKLITVNPLTGLVTVIGDFNDWFWVKSVRRVLATRCPIRTRLRTFPSRFPMLRLDRIYATPSGTIIKAWTDKEAGRYSDHLPVLADIVFEAQGEKSETRKV